MICNNQTVKIPDIFEIIRYIFYQVIMMKSPKPKTYKCRINFNETFQEFASKRIEKQSNERERTTVYSQIQSIKNQPNE